MKIYVGHSTAFDFKKHLYKPLQESELPHEFIFPHDLSDKPFSSKEFFENDCDLMIAEVSLASTGLGMEIAWAVATGVPIIFLYKQGVAISTALESANGTYVAYEKSEDIPTVLAVHLQ